VNVALGAQPVSVCPPSDLNADQSITIDELIAAVADALSGC